MAREIHAPGKPRLEKPSRREFLQLCTSVATAIGLGPEFGPRVYAALADETRPPVIWLHFGECTGCSEALLRSTKPPLDSLIFSSISLEYHETLMAAAGTQAETVLEEAVAGYSGQFFCVVEGSIPTLNKGTYGFAGGETMLSIAQRICPQAAGIIAAGTCSCYGGVAAAAPNPTGAKGVKDALGRRLTVPVINIPGCPPNPVSLVGTIANYLLLGKLPLLDSLGRPLFAYERRVHEQCPYRDEDDDDRCLEDMGCRGKQTYNNCPSVKFNESTSWCVQAGHPCIGCSEPNFWDRMSPFYQERDGDGEGENDD